MSAHGRIRAGHVERLVVRNDRLEVKALWAYSKGGSPGTIRREDDMKRSVSVSLTVVAAVSMAARGHLRLDPCAAASFNEQACQAAIQNRGYCWNGRWVGLKCHYPFPYYYDAYQEYMANGGVVNATVLGSCGPPTHTVGGAHGAAYGGFGATGAGHGANS
jgi:hypothetical protein